MIVIVSRADPNEREQRSPRFFRRLCRGRACRHCFLRGWHSQPCFREPKCHMAYGSQRIGPKLQRHWSISAVVRDGRTHFWRQPGGRRGPASTGNRCSSHEGQFACIAHLGTGTARGSYADAWRQHDSNCQYLLLARIVLRLFPRLTSRCSIPASTSAVEHCPSVSFILCDMRSPLMAGN